MLLNGIVFFLEFLEIFMDKYFFSFVIVEMLMNRKECKIYIFNIW